MSAYDKAYELKRALMDSVEVKEYTATLEKIKANPSNKKMLDDYMKKLMELQAIQLSGSQPDKEKVESLEKLYNIISLNSEIRDFLQHEYKLRVLLNDISKIIFQELGIGYDLDSENENAL